VDRLVTTGLPGAFLYIEDPDGRAVFYTSGYADRTRKVRMTPRSRYRVGSTTKTFTAVVTLQLVRDGRLNLHDTVACLLPDLPVPNADCLTVEHLLRMRSGLFDFEDDPSLLGNLEAHLRPVRLAEAILLGIQHAATFRPGTKFEYCNTNFCLLEMIIERATGFSLAHELERRIFAPLDLRHTTYPPEDDLTLPEPYVRGYNWSPVGWQDCSHVFFGRGDGALISTAADLGTFFRALLVERLLVPPDLLAQMMYVVPDSPPADEAYGLGLIADPLPSGIVWGHAGGGYGYSDFPYIRLETGRFALFMSNGTGGYRGANGNSDRLPRITPALRTSAYDEEAALLWPT
jgi:D-alanyl-D-alanine carboxypeptidase